MPKVPEYNIGQVQQAPIPGVAQASVNLRAGPENFGALQAMDVGNFGRAVQETGMTVLDEANKALVRDALNEARTKSREYMDSALARRGKDAMTVYPDSQKAFTDISKEIGKRFNLPAQQQMFDQVFESMSQSHLDSALSHQRNETTRFEIQTLDAENQNEILDATANPGDVEALNMHLGAIRANTIRKGQMLGLSGEALRQTVIEADNSFHSAIISKLAAQSPTSALDYVTDNEKELDPIAFEKYKTNLTEAANQEQAGVIVAAWSDLPDSVQQANLEAMKKESPDLYKIVRQQLRQENQWREQAQRDADNAVLTDVYSTIEKGILAGSPLESKASVDEAIAKIGDPQRRIQLREYYDNRIAATLNDQAQAQKLDWTVNFRAFENAYLDSEASESARKALLEVNPLDIVDKIGFENAMKMKGWQKHVRGKLTTEADAIDADYERSKSAMLRSVLDRTVPIFSPKKGEELTEESINRVRDSVLARNKAERFIRGEIDRADEAATSKNLGHISEAEVLQIIQDNTVSATTSSGTVVPYAAARQDSLSFTISKPKPIVDKEYAKGRTFIEYQDLGRGVPGAPARGYEDVYADNNFQIRDIYTLAGRYVTSVREPLPPQELVIPGPARSPENAPIPEAVSTDGGVSYGGVAYPPWVAASIEAAR